VHEENGRSAPLCSKAVENTGDANFGSVLLFEHYTRNTEKSNCLDWDWKHRFLDWNGSSNICG
jgi:hypothetical protein